MLIARIEVWPMGDANRGREIARVGIANISELNPVSDYRVTTLLGCDTLPWELISHVHRHRRADGWTPLMARAIDGISTASHTSGPLSPLAEHLLKGAHCR